MVKRPECPKCHLVVFKQLWISPFEIYCTICQTRYDPETGEILEQISKKA